MQTEKERALTTVLLITFVLTLVLLIVFLNIDGIRTEIRTEIAKALLELGVVSIVGVFVSKAVFEYQRERGILDKRADEALQEAVKQREFERQQLEYREGLLSGILARVVAA